MSLLFNQTCLNGRLLPNHTHTHTHIFVDIVCSLEDEWWERELRNSVQSAWRVHTHTHTHTHTHIYIYICIYIIAVPVAFPRNIWWIITKNLTYDYYHVINLFSFDFRILWILIKTNLYVKSQWNILMLFFRPWEYLSLKICHCVETA